MTETPPEPEHQADAPEPAAPAPKRRRARAAHADHTTSGVAPEAQATEAAAPSAAPEPVEEIAVAEAAPEPVEQIVVAEAVPEPVEEIAVAEAVPEPVEEIAVAEAVPAEIPIEELSASVRELEIKIEQTRRAVAEAVEELEVEINNQGERGGAPLNNMAAGVLRLIRQNIERASAQTIEPLAKLVRENLSSDYLDPDFWRGVLMVLQYQVDETRGLVERRLRGEYTVDAYGMDQEIVDLLRPFASFLYRSWWRVSAVGLEHVPDDGAALLLANHAGLLPWDGAMIATAVLEDHPSPRLTRVLHDRWMGRTPLLAQALAAVGQAPARPETAAKLLAEGALVCAFPEGTDGAGKLFRRRYQLADFGDGGYAQAALDAGAPIIPVAVVGVEEAYPMLFDAHRLARLIGLPFLPVTPLFPWLGLLGLIPLPSKWTIVFHAPLTAADSSAGLALSEQARDTIQATLNARVKARRSLFFG